MSITIADSLAAANVFLTTIFTVFTLFIFRVKRAAVAVLRDQMTDQGSPICTCVCPSLRGVIKPSANAILETKKSDDKID
jgi:hypothetical protein